MQLACLNIENENPSFVAKFAILFPNCKVKVGMAEFDHKCTLSYGQKGPVFVSGSYFRPRFNLCLCFLKYAIFMHEI